MPAVFENYVHQTALQNNNSSSNGRKRGCCHQDDGFTSHLHSFFYQTRLSPTSCTSVILDLSRPITPTPLEYVRYLANVLQLMQKRTFLNENPTYVLLNLDNSVGQESVNGRYYFQKINSLFFSHLQFIDVQSKFFVISQKIPNKVTTIVKMICLHCLPTDLNLLQRISNKNQNQTLGLANINQEWNSLHKNQSSAIIGTKRSVLISQDPKSMCSGKKGKFIGDVRLCTVQLLREIFQFRILVDEFSEKWDFIIDFTYYAGHCASAITGDDYEPFTKFTKTVHPNGHNHNQINESMSNCEHAKQPYSIDIDNWQVVGTYRNSVEQQNKRREYIPQSWTKDPLSFLIVLNKGGLNKSALYKPYDATTWILIAISMTIVGFVLTLSVSLHRKFFPQQYRNYHPQDKFLDWYQLRTIIMMVSATITEQNPSDKLARKTIISFRLLFGTWLIISIIISNAYTGIITSFLCSTIPPNDLPQTLQELVEQPYKIFSADTIFIPGPNYNLTFHYSQALIQEYLLFIVESRDETQKAKAYYQETMDSTVYISGMSKEKFILAYQEGLSIPPKLFSLDSSCTTCASKISFDIPSDFAYISTEHFVHRFAALLKDNNNAVVFQPPTDLEAIFVLTAFSVPRNYFSQMFSRKLHQIVEGGLSELWERNSRGYYIRQDINILKCWKQGFDSLADGDEEMIWNTSSCQQPEGSYQDPFKSTSFGNDEESTPLQMGVMSSIFLLWLVGVASATVGLFYESSMFCCRFVYNWILLQRSLIKAKDSRRNSLGVKMHTAKTEDKNSNNSNLQKPNSYTIPGSILEEVELQISS